MEQWQIDAIEQVVAGGRSKKVEEGQYFLNSSQYGVSRSHLLSCGTYDGYFQVDQLDQNERYQQRVRFEQDEIVGLLSVLLQHWFECRKREQEDQLEGPF